MEMTEEKIKLKQNAIFFLRQNMGSKHYSKRAKSQIKEALNLLAMEVVELQISEYPRKDQEEYSELKSFLCGVGWLKKFESHPLGILRKMKQEYDRGEIKF